MRNTLKVAVGITLASGLISPLLAQNSSPSPVLQSASGVVPLSAAPQSGAIQQAVIRPNAPQLGGIQQVNGDAVEFGLPQAPVSQPATQQAATPPQTIQPTSRPIQRQHPTPVNYRQTYGAVRSPYPQTVSPISYQQYVQIQQAQAMVPAYRMDVHPQTNAALYPSPKPNVPIQVGATAITTQALHPHEFLYPHDYRALYPPFYYKVKGSWFVTPFGVWSRDRWELQGTEVKVKYRSKIPLLGGFTTPLNR
ncbi:MAG: hypothetical protein O3A00_12990 [Planctomycetota bacterium]|nr:hypothetical protein [Planctomycetota bacterium]